MEPFDFTRATTVDSLGLPSMENRSTDPVQAKARAIYREVMDRNLPAQTTQDRWNQAKLGYTNHAYLAITTFLRWMRRAEFQVQEKKAAPAGVVAKSMGSSAGAHNSEWSPIDERHPAAKLFKNPNTRQTFKAYLSERTLCRCLFGASYEYVVRDRGGQPRELYIIRPQYIQALPMSPQYPAGGYLVTAPMGMFGSPMPTFWLDSRDVIYDHYDHPLWPWDSYSPNTGGAQMLDVNQATIGGTKKAMDTGFSPKAVITVEGSPGENEMDRIEAKLNANYSGNDRGLQWMLTSAEGGISVAPLNIPPDQMGFGEIYKFTSRFASALYGVPQELSEGMESGSYAKYYALVKAFTTGALGDELDWVGETWTKRILGCYEPWEELKACFTVPTIEDDENALNRIAQLDGLQGVGITVNEARKANNMKPLPDGDVAPMLYKAKIAAQVQAEYPPPAPPVQPGDANGNGDVAGSDASGVGISRVGNSQNGDGDDSQEDESAYPNQLMSHVMSAFGVDAPDNSGSADDTVLEDQTSDVMQKSLNAFYRKSKDASGHEHKGKGPGGGQFGSGGGGTTDQRHNPDLDEAFGAPPEKEKPTSGDPRKNDLLDEAFDPKPPSKRATPVSAKPGESPATQAAAHPAAVLAKQAAKKIPPKLRPVAKIAVAKLKKSPIPATPLAHRQAANPQEWMPKVLAIAVPILAKAMGLDRAAATALMTFGIAAALHQISKQPIPVVQPVKGKAKSNIPVAEPIRQATPIPVAKRVGTSGAPQPKNEAGKGSLPKRMGKSFERPRAEVSDYFATMLGEVCPA